MTSNAVDIGVRVEVPSVFTDAITADLYEPKLLYRSTYFEDPVRTFCMNPHGVVSTESYGDVVTVNGHSYADHGQRTLSTNFALLVSTRFTQPFNDPIAYGKSIARLANLLGSDVIVQRLVDLQAGRRTTPERLARCTVPPTLTEASPGDLSFALPYRHQRDIFDMLEALDGLLPGVAGRDTLLYGVEVKFYSSRMELDRDLRTTWAASTPSATARGSPGGWCRPRLRGWWRRGRCWTERPAAVEARRASRPRAPSCGAGGASQARRMVCPRCGPTETTTKGTPASRLMNSR